jgi:uncharacterized protein YcaQ
MRTIPLAQARRLALHAQGLAAPPAPGTTAESVVARIGCLQLDPVGVVARSPLLVLRARVRGGTHASHERGLARAAYRDRALFDYWCHEASLCHVADLSIHRWAMRTYLDRLPPSRDLVRRWLADNATFAEHVLSTLRDAGPLPAGELEDRAEVSWEWGHWTDEVSSRQNIARMLDRLWMQGHVGIADRAGNARRWDLMERCLPPGRLAAVDAEPLSEEEAVRGATLRALGMLGIAREPQITAHFTRRRYPGLGAVLERLEREGHVVRVEIDGLRGEWWGRTEGVAVAHTLEPGRRTVALSPFDNLVCDRARAAELFGFDHRLEIYVPKGKRRWGYYVLPILHGERLIARADLRIDRDGGEPLLRVLALHREPGRRADGAIRRALESLASWRGAELAALPEPSDV